MQELKDFECPICLEFCRDAVESECCAHAFCKACSDQFIVTKKECPFCRCADFKTRESRILRRVISQIKVECPNKGCEKKVSTGELDKHTNQCQLRALKCNHCGAEFLLKQLLDHIYEAHKQELFTLLAKDNSQSNQASKPQSQIKTSSGIRPQTKFNPTQSVKNSQGRKAGLGVTGKYYCGGELGFKCKCCEGICGPTRGENCVACMELDMNLRNLGKGYLVNPAGRICKIEDKVAYCGSMAGGFLNKTACIKTKQCRPCSELTGSLPRYESLLK